MKTILTLVIFVFSCATFAQTSIVVTPQRPVECELEDHRNVNWISDVEKNQESDTEVIFQFKTKYGFCKDGIPTYYFLDETWAFVGMFAEGLQWPWQKNPFEVSVSGVSSTEVIVVIKFDKVRLFKKRPDRFFSLGFYPTGFVGGLHFGWNVDVYLNSDLETVLSFR